MFTNEQQQIINHFDENFVVNAAPGSGKTFTAIQQALSFVNKFTNEYALIVVFNDHIAQEINLKCNHPRIHCFTMHTLGNAILKTMETGFKFNPYLRDNKNGKYRQILNKLLPFKKGENTSVIKHNCEELLNLGRMTNVNFDDGKALMDLANKYQIAVTGQELSLVNQALKIGIKNFWDYKDTDFTDMLYIPFITQTHLQVNRYIGSKENAKLFAKKYGLIIADEAQDFGVIMQTFCKLFAHDKTIYGFYGDRLQSINGFTGSDTQSFDTLTYLYETVEFSLSTIFRCPNNHVDFINNTFGTNYNAFKQVNGTLESISYNTMYESLQPGDVVLGRFREGKQAKLWDIFFKLLERKVDCSLGGLDAFSMFSKFFPEKLENAKWSNIEFEYRAFVLDEIAKLKEKNWHNKATELEENSGKILQLLEVSDCSSYESFGKWLKKLSYDKKGTVHLSTVHKYKGKENNRIFVIDSQQMPLKVEDTEQQQQEINVYYVATSRSLQDMFFVN